MRLYKRTLYVLTVGLFFLPGVGASDEVWHITTVETVPDSDECKAALALDNNDNPHIVYFYDNDLKYAYFDGSTWQTEIIDIIEGVWCSIAVDSAGHPHILVCRYPDPPALYHGYRDENGWSLTLVDDLDDWAFDIIHIGYCSLALDSSDRPHGSYSVCGYNYYDPYSERYDVRYAFWDGTNWNVEVLETGDEYSFLPTSIALDDNDLPSVLYSRYSDQFYLMYAEFNGTVWEKEIIASTYVEWYVSLVLDTLDNAHISYKDGGGPGGYYLTYAHQSGTGWEIEQLESLPYLGGSNSISLDSNNDPRISFTDDPPEVLKYAHWDGSVWHFEEVDSLTEAWINVSLALDSSDIPHIAYGSDDKLLYASRFNTPPSYFNLSQPPDGGEVPEPVTLDWEDSTDDEGDTITYDVWYATDPSFDPHEEVSDITDSSYTFPEGVLTQGETYYWKVLAWDGYEGTWSGPDEYWSFTVENESPSDFNLTAPPDGSIVIEPVTVDWEESIDPGPMLTVRAGSSKPAVYTGLSKFTRAVTYDVWYATDPSFDPHDEVNELTDSTYTFPEGVLSDGTTYYWKVRAWDGYDETWSGPDPYWSFTVDNELGVPVTGFSADSARDGIELTWECGVPGVGFNLYRSEKATGMVIKSREMLNAELIIGESPYNYLDAGVSDGVTYAYWLEAVNVGGDSETFGPVTCTAGTFVPSSYALYQSRPNPARGTAVIAFDLPEDVYVTLTIYDLSGRKVTTLVNETLPAGAYERPVSRLAPGVYVYRLEAGEFNGIKKMVVIE